MAKDKEVCWLVYCNICKRQHRMTMQNCPTCGVHQTPQPKSKYVHELCFANYQCDGCQAYNDHIT